jgi:hypothetical protein
MDDAAGSDLVFPCEYGPVYVSDSPLAGQDRVSGAPTRLRMLLQRVGLTGLIGYVQVATCRQPNHA